MNSSEPSVYTHKDPFNISGWKNQLISTTQTVVTFLLLRCLPVSVNLDCTGFAYVVHFSRGLILHTTLKSLHHDNKLHCKNFAFLHLQPLISHYTALVNSSRLSNSKTNENQREQKTNPARNLNTSLFTLFALT
jgi:hypothetical protein